MSHTFTEIDCEIISMAIHLSPIDSRRVVVRIKCTWPINHIKVKTYLSDVLPWATMGADEAIRCKTIYSSAMGHFIRVFAVW